ncbi:MAG TPA: hypothetical protein DEQ98_11765, partial [Acidobacteria bacterium]|nr:hypothetical protein [Acidobacteriota bacterium]
AASAVIVTSFVTRMLDPPSSSTSLLAWTPRGSRTDRWRSEGVAAFTERREKPQQIVQVPVSQPIWPERRHQRLGLVLHLTQVGLEISLQPFGGVDDLDREGVLGLLEASDALTLSRHHRHRPITNPHGGARVPNGRHQTSARPAERDARQVRTQSTATASRTMAPGTVRTEHLATLVRVPGRELDR